MTGDDSKRLRVREFVTESLKMPQLSDDADIFEIGGASSLFAVELVLFVEDALDVALEDNDLERENFCSIDAIVALAERKRSSR